MVHALSKNTHLSVSERTLRKERNDTDADKNKSVPPLYRPLFFINTILNKNSSFFRFVSGMVMITLQAFKPKTGKVKAHFSVNLNSSRRTTRYGNYDKAGTTNFS
jgi:hypothetical protein